MNVVEGEKEAEKGEGEGEGDRMREYTHTTSAARFALSFDTSSMVPCSSGKSNALLWMLIPLVARIALTSASLLALPVTKKRVRGILSFLFFFFSPPCFVMLCCFRLFSVYDWKQVFLVSGFL